MLHHTGRQFTLSGDHPISLGGDQADSSRWRLPWARSWGAAFWGGQPRVRGGRGGDPMRSEHQLVGQAGPPDALQPAGRIGVVGSRRNACDSPEIFVRLPDRTSNTDRWAFRADRGSSAAVARLRRWPAWSRTVPSSKQLWNRSARCKIARLCDLRRLSKSAKFHARTDFTNYHTAHQRKET